MKCQSCQHINYVGAIFCLNCGVSLLAADRSHATMQIGAAEPTQPRSDKPAQRRGTMGLIAPPRGSRDTNPLAAPDRAAGAPHMRMTILNTGRAVDLPLNAPILVGREDSTRGFFPDLDLNRDGGFDSGVSRRHARIARIDDDVFIEDLQSANGTFINEQRARPGSTYRLKAGDEIRFGSLILRIDHL